jgi:hypothetical protein
MKTMNLSILNQNQINMRKLLLILVVLLSFVTAKAQNPFAEYGYTPKIATLSQGQYNEFFDNDTLVQIGSVLFNTKSKQIVAFIETDTLYSEATLEPDIVSRWISPDPLSEERSWLSPYNYCQNNPIILTDPNGALDTKYQDEEGNLLLNTNDGSDAVVTVTNDKLDGFKSQIAASSNPGMKDIYDSKGWNDYWKEDLLGFRLSDRQEGLLHQLNSDWSRSAAINYWQSGEMSDGLGFAIKEALSQWTNPELVLAGMASGIAGVEAASTSKVYRVYGGDAQADGFSWTPQNPNKVSNFRNSAGLPSGGASGANNTGRFVIEGTVNKSNIINTRSALPLDGNKGGLWEYILDPSNVRIKRVSGVNPEF